MWSKRGITVLSHSSKKRKNVKADAKIAFDIPDRCTTKFLNSPYYMGAQIWNLLTETIQRSNTQDIFLGL